MPVIIQDGRILKAMRGTMLVKEVDYFLAIRIYECVDCGRKKIV